MTRHFPCSSGTVIAFNAASSARTSIRSPPPDARAQPLRQISLCFFSCVVSNSVLHLSPTTASEGENVQRTVSVERRILVRFPWVGARDGAGEDAQRAVLNPASSPSARQLSSIATSSRRVQLTSSICCRRGRLSPKCSPTTASCGTRRARPTSSICCQRGRPSPRCSPTTASCGTRRGRVAAYDVRPVLHGMRGKMAISCRHGPER